MGSDKSASHDEPKKAHTICPDCGGVMMGPIYWVDDAPVDAKICRRGRVLDLTGDRNGGDYDCAGAKLPGISFSSW